MLVLLASLGASCRGSGALSGRVTQLEGGPLAGASVTVDGLTLHQQLTTDTDGRFTLADLAPGSYTVSADRPGFTAEARRDVRVARNASATEDFVLHPACLEEGSYVDGGLTWGLQAAQAVLHVRINAAMPPDRWIANNLCVVGIDHTATVISILNMGPDSKDIPKTVHIVKDGRVAFPLGSEYIAFVRWEAAIGRYRPIAGPIFMLPIHDDKIAWARTDAPNLHDGQNVTQAMAELFALLPSALGAR